MYRSPSLTDAAKVVMLYLADHLRQDMTVSVPRSQVAGHLGRSERKVSQRVAEGHEAGFLSTKVHGRKHVTAVYQATFPEVLRVTEHSTLRGAETVTLRNPNQALSVTPGFPPIEQRNLPDGVANRNVSSEEQSA